MLRALFLTAFLLGPLQAQSLDSILAKMDTAAAAFQSMTAHVRSLKHTDIVKDDTVDEGTIWVKRLKPRVSRILIEFTTPNQYYVAMSEKKVEIYRPKIAQVEEYDVSKYRDLADQLWPFGTSGRDLASYYQITAAGEETVAASRAVKLNLVPKSPKLRQSVPKAEMWVSTTLWQPVQQKFYDVTPGDYRVSTYSDIKMNAPVPDSRLRLSVPSGVKRLHPQK